MNKHGFGIIPIIIIIAIVATLAILITANEINFASVTGQPTYPGFIQLPVSATISCVQSGQAATLSYQTDSDLNIPNGGYWLSDNLPSNTNAWNVQLNVNPGFFSCIGGGDQVEIYECTARNFASCYFHQFLPQGLVIANQQTIQLGSIPSTNYVWVQTQCSRLGSKIGINGGTATVTYNPYILQRSDVLRGGITYFANNIGCNVPNSDSSIANAIISEFGISTNTQVYHGNQMQPGQSFNYITGTVTSITQGNTATYNGQQVYCVHQNGNGNAAIYPIGQITTNSNTYRVVDLTSNPIVSNLLCCPGDNLPNGQTCADNFRWTQIANSQCDILRPCGGSGWVPNLQNPTQVISYQCINNQCVAQTKTVDCTINSQCATNQICDPANYKCVDASQQGSGLMRGVNYLNGGLTWWEIALIIIGIALLLFILFRFGVLQKLVQFFLAIIKHPAFWITAAIILLIIIVNQLIR